MHSIGCNKDMGLNTCVSEERRGSWIGPKENCKSQVRG